MATRSRPPATPTLVVQRPYQYLFRFLGGLSPGRCYRPRRRAHRWSRGSPPSGQKCFFAGRPTGTILHRTQRPTGGDRGLSGEWFTVPRPAPAARLRLVCFPYAGGGASAYWRCAAALPAGIELAAVTLPGREARLDEPPRENLAMLLPELLDALARYRQPVAFFGHSMGALIAFELCRALAREG